MKKEKRTLTYYEIFAYGTGGIFINLAGAADQFGMYFLTNVAMMPAAVVGVMMMATTIFDAINDPIIGNLADQCNTRIGKYRPFLIFGGILTCIVSILRFTTPPLQGGGQILFYFIILCLYSIGLTSCSIPWQTMMSVLTPDYNERNILLCVRSVSGNLVGMFVNAIILASVAKLGGAQQGGWWKFMVLAWLIALPFVFICQHGMRRVDYQYSIPNPPKTRFFTKLKHILGYKPVFCLCLAFLVSSLVISLSNTCEMYFYQYVLEDTRVLSKISVLGFPVTIGCTLLLPVLLKIIDKKHLLFIAFSISLVKPVWIFLYGADVTSTMVIFLTILSRIGTALLSAAIYAWVPECVDYTNWKDGFLSAGLITSVTTFVMKLGRAAGQSLSGILMSSVGFQAGQAAAPAVIQQILNINGLYQIIGLCLTLIPILFFPISRAKADQIRWELAQRSIKNTDSI